MGQAGLVQGWDKLTRDPPASAPQKAGKVRPPHHRRLFKPTPRLNRIDRDLRSTEGPHPPQLSAHSPSGLVRGYTGTAANLLDQRLISRLPLVRPPGHGLAQSSPTHPQSEGFFQYGGGLAVGQSQTFIELRGQGQRSRTQLRSGAAHGIGGLPGMPALDPSLATPTTSHLKAKTHARHSCVPKL